MYTSLSYAPKVPGTPQQLRAMIRRSKFKTLVKFLHFTAGCLGSISFLCARDLLDQMKNFHIFFFLFFSLNYFKLKLNSQFKDYHRLNVNS